MHILKLLQIIFFTILIQLSSAYAGLVLGSGMSSATGGRVSPMIYTGIDTATFALVGSSVGVKTGVYYHSAYNLSGYFQKDYSNFLWGKVRAGFGAGVHVSKRRYNDGTADDTFTDYAVGPSIRSTWEILPLIVIGIEGIYGIRSGNIFVLSSQRVVNLFFGVRF